MKEALELLKVDLVKLLLIVILLTGCTVVIESVRTDKDERVIERQQVRMVVIPDIVYHSSVDGGLHKEVLY
jgi:hypothetical protein